jgi:hypothetical protein
MGGLLVSCYHIAPKDTSTVVGMEGHSSNDDLISWYCQELDNNERGDLIDCTKDGTAVIAENLPSVAGVASDYEGNLIILYLIDSAYWLGDISGPKEELTWLATEIIVDDIATNDTGNDIFGLCYSDNLSYDCFRTNGVLFNLADDQRRVGLTLDDTSSSTAKTWCAFPNGDEDEVIECELIETE